jgi:aminomethyltransferase
MDIGTNPFELGLGRLVDLEMDADFIGKSALATIKATGVSRQLVGLEIDAAPLERPNAKHWPLHVGAEDVGHITSAVYSPRLKQNIALGIVAVSHARMGQRLKANGEGGELDVTVVEKPFYDPKKRLASS